MQPYIIGERKEGDLQLIPPKMLSEAVPGQIYEAHIKTQGLLGQGGTSKKNIAGFLTSELPRYVPGIKVKWVEVNDTNIKLQFLGGPFTWALFLQAIPFLLSLIGVTVSLIGIYLIWGSIPGWTIGILFIGLALLFVVPKVSKKALVAWKEVIE